MRLKGKSKFEYILETLAILEETPSLSAHLDVVARKIHISPQEFHRLFIDWCGTGPVEFLRFTKPEYSKFVLANKSAQKSLFENPYEHYQSVNQPQVTITQMTNEEAKSENMMIHYSMAESLFGRLFIASTSKGICYMVFSQDEEKEILNLKKLFPKAHIRHQPEEIQEKALLSFLPERAKDVKISLHLKGTDFQIQVWKALLTVPFGSLATYHSIAKKIGSPRSARAAGTAIGDNPVTYIVPCHRIVRSSGEYGNYMWGSERKLAMIGWEAVNSRLK
ncbi:MAG: bifunctional helix-turn-helix domain-containing protein/methylated-DNA--[protein]-cysteine S-methyltransferase [Bacteroidetes bacterium]|nr:bifunctional helix-turn-helix domain-containing protein/methylated-DNA--[protein]-cysteine S-methyltransferase [Bacteroidota bacterium]